MIEFMDEAITVESVSALSAYHVPTYGTPVATVAKIERVRTVFFDASGQSQIADATAYLPGFITVALGSRITAASEVFEAARVKTEYLDGAPDFHELKLSLSP